MLQSPQNNESPRCLFYLVGLFVFSPVFMATLFLTGSVPTAGFVGFIADIVALLFFNRNKNYESNFVSNYPKVKRNNLV